MDNDPLNNIELWDENEVDLFGSWAWDTDPSVKKVLQQQLKETRTRLKNQGRKRASKVTWVNKKKVNVEGRKGKTIGWKQFWTKAK